MKFFTTHREWSWIYKTSDLCMSPIYVSLSFPCFYNLPQTERDLAVSFRSVTNRISLRPIQGHRTWRTHTELCFPSHL